MKDNKLKNIAYNEKTGAKLRALAEEFYEQTGEKITYRTILARLVNNAKIKDLKI